jgi:hypothetical protein
VFRSVDFVLQITSSIKVTWVRSGELAGYKPQLIISPNIFSKVIESSVVWAGAAEIKSLIARL